MAYRRKLEGSRRNPQPSASDKTAEELAYEQLAQDLRKTTAEADRLELKLAQARGEVVEIKDVEASIAKVAGSIKTAILAMPVKLANRGSAVKDKGSIRAILDREARDLCARLAAIGKDSAPAREVVDADD